jgi:hypothetical protein
MCEKSFKRVKFLTGTLKKKEDLIGVEVECPFPNCDVRFTLTKEPHEHIRGSHYYSTNLDEQYQFYLLGRKEFYKTWFNEDLNI